MVSHVPKGRVVRSFMIGLALASLLLLDPPGPRSEGGPWDGIGLVAAQTPGGGTVADTPPEFSAFTVMPTTVDNSGSSFLVFKGTMFDPNGEGHFAGAVVAIAATGAVIEAFSHTVSPTEAQTAAEPATFGPDGFKLYSDVLYDGILYFKMKYTVPTGTSPGTATFSPTVTNPGGSAVLGPDATVTILVHSEITISPTPVDSNGADSDATWGLWEAAPGTARVASTNFLKAINSGQRATASFVTSFSEPSFTGANPNYEIPINGNVQFAWCEVESELVSPSACSFEFGTTSSDGSLTATFTAIGRVIYVQYRIVQIPAVIVSQAYGATFTSTEI